MLVPESEDQPSGTEERTSTPGAATSGFRRWDIVVGPTDEKSAWVPFAGAPVISTAPTVIALREFAGDEMEPAPRSLKSFPAATTGTTPAVGRSIERERDDVSARLDLGLADREVEDVHPVPHRGLDRGDDLGRIPVRAQAGVRSDERLVVADVRARRDARDDAAGRSRVCVRCRRRSRRRASRGRSCLRRTASLAFRFLAPGGGNARATMTFAFVNRVCPFGKPAGIA